MYGNNHDSNRDNEIMVAANSIDNCLELVKNVADRLEIIYHQSFTMRDTKILVVDDNEVNNYVIKEMLSQFNIEADIALSGEEAIKMFEKKEYDIILVDYLASPGIGGIETIRRVRESGEKGRKQLIIGLKTQEEEVFKEELDKYDVELVLFKPVKYQQMSVILQREFPEKINVC